MSILFESAEINGMKLQNRFVRSATWEGMATPEGAVTPKLIETMARLAKGGVGLIISSHTYVRREGRQPPADRRLPGRLTDRLREMTAVVHEVGGKICLQLAHAGNFAAEALTGAPPRVVSDYEGLAKTPRKELTSKDMSWSLPLPRRPAGPRRRASTGSRSTRRMAICSASSFPRRLTGARTAMAAAPEPVPHPSRDPPRHQTGYGEHLSRLDQDELPGLHRRRPQPGRLHRRRRPSGRCGPRRHRAERRPALQPQVSPSRPHIDSEEKEAYFREESHAFRKRIPLPRSWSAGSGLSALPKGS